MKLARANEHLEAFRHELEAFRDSPTFRNIVTLSRDVVTVEGGPADPPPVALSCLIGDCVVNLRTALDYVAWQLALKYWRPSPVEGKARIYFADPNTLANAAMDPAVLALVKRMQSTMTGYGALGVLTKLVNTDKHNVPLLTFAVGFPTHFEVAIGGLFKRAGAVTSTSLALGASGIAAPKPEDVRVRSGGSVFVTFENPRLPQEPAEEMLTSMAECVEDIVEALDGVFL